MNLILKEIQKTKNYLMEIDIYFITITNSNLVAQKKASVRFI